MDFFEVVNNRYSNRTLFKDKKIPDSEIRKIIDAGIRAPSGMNCQSTSFVIVDDQDLKKKISEAIPTPATKSASFIIVVLSENIITPCGKAFETEDYAAATENILLAVSALGYATVWMDGMTKDPDANNKIRNILNVPDNKTIRTVLPVGIPEVKGVQRERKSFEERCTYNKF